MISRRIEPVFVLSIAVIIILSGIAGFASYYAARQSSLYISHTIDDALGNPSSRSPWTNLRDGYVFGRTDQKNGSTSYIVVTRRPDGEFRVVINVDQDGSIIDAVPIGSSNGFPYARRIGVLFDVAEGTSAHGEASPLDVALRPMVVNALEAVTRLERSRAEETDGD
jgi:hypothetical protein